MSKCYVLKNIFKLFDSAQSRAKAPTTRRPRDLHERREGGARDGEVVPGDGEAAVETSGVQEKHHDRHGEAEAPRRHAEHAVRAAEAGIVGHHGDHRTARGQLAKAGGAQRRAEGPDVEVRTTVRIHNSVSVEDEINCVQ